MRSFFSFNLYTSDKKTSVLGIRLTIQLNFLSHINVVFFPSKFYYELKIKTWPWWLHDLVKNFFLQSENSSTKKTDIKIYDNKFNVAIIVNDKKS